MGGEDDLNKDFFVASDATAILSHTRDIVFLGDEEMAVITRSGVSFTDFYGTTTSPVTQRVLWDPITTEKAGYPHFMLKEIFEQPTAVRQTIGGHVTPGSGRGVPEGTEPDRRAARRRSRRSSCWRAGRRGTRASSASSDREARARPGRSGLRVGVPVPPSDRRRQDARRRHHAVGRDGGHAGARCARPSRKQTPSVAICNVIGSMATREADGTVYTHAGPEIGVASTKAFTSQLVALYLLGLKLAQARGVMTAGGVACRTSTRLLQLPQVLEQTLRLAPQMETIAQAISCRTDALFLGRGINYPIALEGALKLKEISYIHAEGYPAGEMKHGPIALIDERMPVVVLAPQDGLFEKMVGNIQEAKARGGSDHRAHERRRNPHLESILDPRATSSSPSRPRQS